MSRQPGTGMPKPRKGTVSNDNDSREAQLDEALEGTFPASDPVSAEHSEHAGVPPEHKASARKARTSKRKRS